MLSRQWKNTLYTPLMPQNTLKSRLKPVNVTIAVPDIQEVSFFLILKTHDFNILNSGNCIKQYYYLNDTNTNYIMKCMCFNGHGLKC